MGVKVWNRVHSEERRKFLSGLEILEVVDSGGR